MLAVGVWREHDAEPLAGAAGDVAQEIALRPAAAPVLLDDDGGAVGQLETRDVERVATGMLAPAMLAAGLAPARIGADLAHEPDTLAEMGEGGSLHVLAREGVELPREAAAHQTRGAPGDARGAHLDGIADGAGRRAGRRRGGRIAQAEPVQAGEALRRIGRRRTAGAGGEQDQPCGGGEAGQAVGAGHATGATAGMPATESHKSRRRNGFVRRAERRVGEDRRRHAAADPLPFRETPMPQVALKDAFSGARVMVTGGLGFIGSTLGARLVELGADVLLVDNLLAEYGGNFFNVAPIRDKVTIEIADIRDVRAMRALLKGCRYLFNLAGQTSHADSMIDPETDLAINCRAQLTLLEACRQICAEVGIVYASTRQIYGRPRYLPVDEKHPLRPVDVNGVNKMAGEAYHMLFHDVYGIRATALRLTNVYGPRMRIKDARQTFIGVWLRAVLEGRPFEVWNGAQLRDLSYVDDAVEALLLAAATTETAGGVFNVGGDRVVSLKELADMLVAAQGGGGYELREFPPERKRIDIGDYHTDDALFRRVSGWAPRTPLPDGLARSLAYFRAHLPEYL